MIDQPWPALTFLLILEIALIGAFWKLSNHIDKIQNEYSEKIPMIEAIIRSTGTLPVIIKLIGFIDNDRQSDPNASLEKILSAEQYNESIIKISNFENKNVEIKNAYKFLKKNISHLSRNILLLALIVPAFFFINILNFFNLNNNYFITSCLFISAPIIFFIIDSLSKTLQYRTLHSFLSTRYDEIVMKVPEHNGNED